MADKVLVVTTRGGQLYGWKFRCPACEAYFAQKKPELLPEDRIFYAQAIVRARTAGSGGWEFDGDLQRPTFSPSFLVYADGFHPRCHSFVRAGKIEYLGDCDHAFAGQTLEIPEWVP
jgi:hypothetical protein